MDKTCPACGETKELDAFYKRPDGRPQGYCKACSNRKRRENYVRSPEQQERQRAIAAAWYAKNKQHANERSRRYQAENRERLARLGKERTLKRKYGITISDYDTMLERQCGVCAVCLGPQRHGWTYFCVDHDHTTGAVRGLLCDFCNRAVGSLEDDAVRAERLAVYLRA